MLVTKEIRKGSSRLTKKGWRWRKRRRLLFSSQKELLHSQKRAFIIALERSASSLRHSCNLEKIEDIQVEDDNKSNPKNLQLIDEEIISLCSLRAMLYSSVSKT